jgi:hypothetical protein
LIISAKAELVGADVEALVGAPVVDRVEEAPP